MENVPATTEDNKRTVGRKDKTGATAVKKPKLVAEALPDIITRMIKHKNMGDKLNDDVTALAEKSGFSASSIKKLAKANAGDKFEEIANEVGQQNILFEDVGVVKLG